MNLVCRFLGRQPVDTEQNVYCRRCRRVLQITPRVLRRYWDRVLLDRATAPDIMSKWYIPGEKRKWFEFWKPKYGTSTALPRASGKKVTFRRYESLE